jgi:Domain of Unknown Function (DUF1080)
MESYVPHAQDHVKKSRASHWMPRLPIVALGLAVGALALFGQTKNTTSISIRLDSLNALEIVGGKAEVVTYGGRRALHLSPPPDHENKDEAVLAIVTATDFTNGTVEVEVAGKPRAGAPTDSRGFIGIMLRAQDHGAKAENFYLRPTNGRANDQLRRNHAVQYESEPDFPWSRLRKESPGVYESYADLEPGVWTKMKIVASGTTAQLYINGADQPCLVVNDLKLGEAHGQIALWMHATTDGYFSNLVVKPAE